MHLIFIGAPGSGKGTQAEKIRKNLSYEHISTGDLLRLEVSKGSELGLKIKTLIDSGSLVDDHTVLELFSNNLRLGSKNYILDGFPRTLNQCKMLDEKIFVGSKYKTIYFEIDEERVLNRIINRRVAPKSGKIYNLITDPPEVDGVCDISGEPLIHRDDDKEEVVRNRLDVYRKSIVEIVDYYDKSSKLLRIDASLSSEKVYADLVKGLN